ncbi:MAG TPA: acyl-CoA dehydrogenase family protein [Xanthobacteraceae bacterium]|nr:acyl-CoA dehydrogenase family protein [Xanthobacteraceae bacterium]
MDLHLTSEQSLLRDSAAKFVASAGPRIARGFRGKNPSFSPARLREAGELGWLGMLVPTSADGLGLGLTELALVLEQAGRGLVCEPIGLAAISAAALAQGHAPHPMLQRVMRGEALVVPALQESAHAGDPRSPATRANGDRAPRLTGTKVSVCADGADGFLVGAGGPDGPALYYVARDASGVSLAAAPSVDGRALATLTLADAPADLVPARQSSRSAPEALADLALIALSAELLGVMQAAQEMTFDYLRIRKQFGKPIGSFQALQHKAVDIYIKTETTRSLIYQVAAANDPYRVDPALAVAVKAKASEDALAVTQACIQLHGAIGFTDEHDIGLYLKRAMLLSSLFGNAAAQRRRYADIAELGV